ncbi:MAG TPA: copper resistance CopC family protein [Casimicrobiaceae bacterium]|nr:copper resistance CopC family protein [Casimicrobiaceae bacterium]
MTTSSIVRLSEPVSENHRRRSRIAIRLALVSITALPTLALAHAVVLASQPTAGAVVASGELRITLRFSSRVDAMRSRLRLIPPNGVEAVVPFADGGPGIVSARVRVDAPGRWILRWQVLSIDGHVTRGDVPFAVARPSAGK